MEATTTELIEHQTITAIVENVAVAKDEVRQAFALLQTAKTRLAAALGDGRGGTYHQIIPSRNYYGDNCFEEKSLVESHKMITQNAWRYILAQTGLNHYMTEKRKKELNEQIEKNELPELTTENILGTLQGLAGKVHGLLEESIKEVFDWLRPRSAWGCGALKTNEKFKIGPKVIVYGVERNWSKGFRFNYHYEANFRSLGNVFSLLDGKGVLKYPEDFVTKFNEAMKESHAGDKFDWEYFEIKCYRNGHAHIKFKRLDLVRRLNKVGGGDELPQGGAS